MEIAQQQDTLKKFLVVGYGNMAKAMVKPITEEFDFTVVTPNSTPNFSCNLYRSFEELSNQPETPVFDIVLFAVKPYHIDKVLDVFPADIFNNETQFISILVGIERAYFRRRIAEGIKIARVMPSLPVSVNKVRFLVAVFLSTFI